MLSRQEAPRIAAVLALMLLVPDDLCAQRELPDEVVGTARLEVVSDSVGLPVVLNGVLVGVTPAQVQVPAAQGVRVEIGAGRLVRSLSVDMPAAASIRIEVLALRDTQPVPEVRSAAAIVQALGSSASAREPSAPARPYPPRVPTVGKSISGGLLFAVAAAAVGTKTCSREIVAPEPQGTYVGGTFFPPGIHTIGPSFACVGRLTTISFGVGSLLVHHWQSWEYRRRRRAFGNELARWAVADSAYRNAVARRIQLDGAEIRRVQQEEIERRQRIITDNASVRQSNAQLPVVTFANAPGARVVGGRTTLVPPTLRVLSLALDDTDGDSVLAAGERAFVVAQLTNDGMGPALDVRVTPTTQEGLQSLAVPVGPIEPGDTVSIRVPVTATREIRDGETTIDIVALERNGFDSDPFRLLVSTLGYRAPDLNIIDVGVEDADGRSIITPGTAVTITVRVQNRGGSSEGAQVVFERGDSTLFFTSNSASGRVTLPVGRLRRGEVRDVSVEVISNRRATRFPLRAGIAESSGRLTVPLRDLGLSLRTPLRTVATARAGSVGGASGGVAGPVSLASELLSRVPTARVKNPDAFAIIIGNRNYRQAPPVSFAANDAAVMRQYAEHTLGILPGNIIEVSDATKASLEDLFGVAGNPEGRLKGLLVPGRSDVFVFYSGHGAPDPRAERAYLMPVDANADRIGITGYSLDLLYENLAALRARHVTVVLDACFTGATASGEMLITAASPIGLRVNDPSARFAGGAATVIAAASGQQLANWYPDKRHGMLTFFFLRGLRGDADLSGDGRITVGEMKAWLQDVGGVSYEARRLFGRDQLPQVWGDPARVLRP